jgi:NAD(P)H-nitrite reductase large subunit
MECWKKREDRGRRTEDRFRYLSSVISLLSSENTILQYSYQLTAKTIYIVAEKYTGGPMLEDGEKGSICQRDKKTYAIAPHIPCGIVTPDILRSLADAGEKYKAAALKITSAARIAIIGLEEKDLDSIWQELEMESGAATGLCIRSIKACPGIQFCRYGQQDSLGMGMELDKKFHGMELPGKLKMGVSGCPNQCAETCIKEIGLIGYKSGWKVVVGGNGGVKARLARDLVKGVSNDEALDLIDRIIKYYQENGKKNKRLGAMIEVWGFEEFKKALHIPD